MSKNYYISDTHFFHGNVVRSAGDRQFENRPFDTLDEMHTKMKENWNNTVTNADHVYILGDLTWKVNDESIAFISTLKGNKHLILGNHDQVKDQRFKQLFVEVVNYKELQDTVNGKQQWVVMSHFPMMFWNHNRKYRRDGEFTKNYAIHLYGHVHDSVEHELYLKFLDDLNEEYDIKCEAYNVGAMLPYMNYTPRTLEEIIGKCRGWKDGR